MPMREDCEHGFTDTLTLADALTFGHPLTLPLGFLLMLPFLLSPSIPIPLPLPLSHQYIHTTTAFRFPTVWQKVYLPT